MTEKPWTQLDDAEEGQKFKSRLETAIATIRDSKNVCEAIRSEDEYLHPLLFVYMLEKENIPVDVAEAIDNHFPTCSSCEDMYKKRLEREADLSRVLLDYGQSKKGDSK